MIKGQNPFIVTIDKITNLRIRIRAVKVNPVAHFRHVLAGAAPVVRPERPIHAKPDHVAAASAAQNVVHLAAAPGFDLILSVAKLSSLEMEKAFDTEKPPLKKDATFSLPA